MKKSWLIGWFVFKAMLFCSALAAACLVEAECLKGDVEDEDWVYRGGSRKMVGVLWAGASPDEFGLVWDGMDVVARMFVSNLIFTKPRSKK